METLHVSSGPDGGEDSIETKRSPLVPLLAGLLALALTGGLFAGYLYLRKRHAEQVNAESQKSAAAATSAPAPSPEVHVFVDDVLIQGPQRILGGTVQNISAGTLNDLSVEIELKRRRDNGTETQSVPLTPKDLSPNQQGRYALKVFSQDYGSLRVVRVSSGSRRPSEIAFKSSPGAQRPPEYPKQEVKTIIVKKPARRENGEEFINDPNNPARVP